MDDLGTTFGGGPMACALIEAVVDVIESEGLLAQRARAVGSSMRETCVVGPVDRASRAPASCAACARAGPRRTCRANCSQHDILAGTSGDPHVVRLLPPFVLEEHAERRRCSRDCARGSSAHLTPDTAS